MKSIITKGFLLNKTTFSDNKNIVNAYTQDLGKISCSVIGTTKIGSKMNSHLQMGRLLKLYLVKTNNYYRLANIETISSFESFYKSYNSTIYLFTLLEIINKIYEEEFIDRRIFDFFIKSMEFFDNSNISEISKMNCIIVKIISLNGLYGTNLFEFINDPSENIAIENARSAKYLELSTSSLNFNNEYLILKKLIMFIEDEFNLNIKSIQALTM